MRLDKFISQQSDYSRSEVKKLIRAQRISINDAQAMQADVTIDPQRDRVCIDGEWIRARGESYLMLHKPAGVVCANQDSAQPTVIDLLRQMENDHRQDKFPLPVSQLQIVGRLDKDTTGLVLLTTDGQWNRRVSAPGGSTKKIYQVTLDQAIDERLVSVFAEGLMLHGESKATRPADLHIESPTQVRLALSEGRYHQVKRMFAACGRHVEQLHRCEIAGVALDSALAPGHFRELNEAELQCIAHHIQGRKTL